MPHNLHVHRVMLSLCALVVLFGAVQPSSAQQNQRATDPARAVLRVESTKQFWTVRSEVLLVSPPPPTAISVRDGVSTNPFLEMHSLEMAYPVISDTASSVAERFRFAGELWIANQMVSKSPRILEGYQGLSSISVWTAENIRTQSLALKVSTSAICYQTQINERVARTYSWPKHPWSEELAACLEPQEFVEVQDAAIQELARRWTEGRPRDARPYDLAKHLAAQSLEHFRLTQGLFDAPSRYAFARHEDLGVDRMVNFYSDAGFRVNGAAHAARTGEGSPYDLACLLTAVYRAAGIPSRMVIGYDIKRSTQEKKPILRAWVEFFLARDPMQEPESEVIAPVSPGDGEWIPVDIIRQQEFASRAPPVNQRWQFFGNNDELDMIPPIAFHWLPPSAMTNNGSAAIWGWLPQPGGQRADQRLRFGHLQTPKRGDDPDVRRR